MIQSELMQGGDSSGLSSAAGEAREGSHPAITPARSGPALRIPQTRPRPSTVRSFTGHPPTSLP